MNIYQGGLGTIKEKEDEPVKKAESHEAKTVNIITIHQAAKDGNLDYVKVLIDHNPALKT